MGYVSPLTRKTKRVNVLSLFDGMSCGQIALGRADIEVGNYYAAEIDRYAIQVTQANYPNTIQMGSVTNWESWDLDWSSIDIVSGGFPCQAWSVAGKQLGDKDERGALFWVMLDIMKKAKEANPSVKFLIENVKMKKDFEEYVTFHTSELLGDIHKTLINSALVSAQNRNRYYWTNFHVSQPADLGASLSDIIEDPAELNQLKLSDNERVKGMTENEDGFRPHRGDGSSSGIAELGRILKPTASKCQTLTTSHQPKILVSGSTIEDIVFRSCTVTECEQLQTVPVGYTAHVSNTQRYKMLGNGWTVDVIAHIYKCMIKHELK